MGFHGRLWRGSRRYFGIGQAARRPVLSDPDHMAKPSSRKKARGHREAPRASAASAAALSIAEILRASIGFSPRNLGRACGERGPGARTRSGPRQERIHMVNPARESVSARYARRSDFRRPAARPGLHARISAARGGATPSLRSPWARERSRWLAVRSSSQVAGPRPLQSRTRSVSPAISGGVAPEPGSIARRAVRLPTGMLKASRR